MSALAAETPKPQPPAPPPPASKPLSEGERRELLGSVDGILHFASEDSGLPIHQSVRSRLVSRDEVTRYLAERFKDDEGAKRLERSELVLKKFGLLPRSFDLKPFLLRLLTEQIAGYYDDQTKTVNLLNWVPAEEQRPVLAHELTHALQDQAVGLERWSDSGLHGIARTTAEQAEAVRRDEWETARSAVAEGQAMLVFTDYALRPTHHTLLDSPETLDRLLTADTSAADEGSPVLAEAPRVLQEALLFPYTDGLAFEAALLRAGGKVQAFNEPLARPPSSSYEVMTPKAYLQRQMPPVLPLPDLNAVLGPAWTPYDVGAIGELDARMLMESYGDGEDAKTLPALWDGGTYYAAQRSDVHGELLRSTQSLGLVYVSRWRDEDAATKFAELYRAALAKRYHSAEPEANAVPGQMWMATEEGGVLVMRSGRMVLSVEGFARAEAEKIASAMLAHAGEPEALHAGGKAVRETTGPHTLVSALCDAAGAGHYTLMRLRLSGR